MRVICIDDKWENVYNSDPFVAPKFGEECETIHREKCCESNAWYYTLVGYTGYFETIAFIPLSNIDEKELLEERELQFQNA